MRLLPRLGAAVAALALVIGMAGLARAAVLWTLTASPLTVTAGTSTTFSLRASLTLLGEIRCVEVGVPDNFLVTGAAVTGSNAGDAWTSQVVGNDVFVRVTSGGDRLRTIGHYVDFTITATAWSPGSLAWASHSHDQADCTGPESLLSLPPIVLVLGTAPTPTPKPTPAPTPRPTTAPSILPTLSPIAIPTLPPIALPTPPPSASTGLPQIPGTTPGPTAAPSSRATPMPAATTTSPSAGSPSPAASPSASSPTSSPRSDEGGVASPPAAEPPAGSEGSVEGLIVSDPASAGGEGAAASVPVALGALGLLGSIDIWIVPGLLLGVPGLLVVAFVILQAIGALAWVPAIRRLRGDEPEPGVA